MGTEKDKTQTAETAALKSSLHITKCDKPTSRELEVHK
jgi:hypothetical protein